MNKTSIKYIVNGSFTLKGESIRVNTKIAELTYLFTQSDAPKTYKKLGIIERKNSSLSYESGLITIFSARDSTLRFETYHDGNFNPYYGRIRFLERLDVQ